MSDNTNSETMDFDSIPIVIEEIDSGNIPEDELSQFIPTETISFNEPVPGPSSSIMSEKSITESEKPTPKVTTIISPEEEEELIKKLIDGELTFSEYNEQMGHDNEGLEQDDYEEVNDDVKSDDQVDVTVDEFERELFHSRRDAMRGQFSGQVSKEGRTMRRRRCILPPALQGLMGEANLSYARGNKALAEKVCLEIIRQVPLAAEPFLTLAQIYDGTDNDKWMQFMLIAAHLNPGDADHWVRLADASIEMDNLKQAIFCYTKAIKASPKDMSIRMKRIQLLQSMGEEKYAFQCYFGMLKFMPKEEGEFLLSTAKMVAHRFYKENNFPKALEAMRRAYDKIPKLFKTEDLNLFLELLITAGLYKNVLAVLIDHTDVIIETLEEDVEDSAMKSYQIISCTIPDNLLLDFRTKLAVSLIHLKAFHLIDSIIQNIFLFMDVENAGDCYLDIAEALMKEGKHNEALRLLVPLVQSKNFSLAAVWLRHADCYRAIGDFDEAIESYKNVVNLAPQHLDARLTLSALLKQKNKHQEALKALEQDLECDLLDPKLLYERCFMLKETGNLEQYVDLCYILISRHCIRYRDREELEMASSIHKVSNKVSNIKELREMRLESIEDSDGPEFSKTDNEPPVDVEWELFRDVVKTAHETKRFDVMQKLTFAALSSKRFQPFLKDIEFMALLSCIYNRDSYLAYNIVKEFLNKNTHSSRAWNMFNLVIQFTEEVRYSKFLNRLFERCRLQVHPMTHTLQANYCLVSGTYKYALNDYISTYHKTKSPMLALLIGITLCQMGCQKFFAKRQSLISQAIAFFKEYEKAREPEAWNEVLYNLGRMYHQIGMLPVAVHYYKQVLDYTNDLIKEHSDYLDLKMEAAYNLHLIYKQSGNNYLARKYLLEYIVV